MSDEPRIARSGGGEEAVLSLTGHWTADHAQRLEGLALESWPRARRLIIDLGGVGLLDTFGACAIAMLRDSARRAGVEAILRGVAARNAPILERIGAPAAPPAPPPRPSPLAAPEKVGRVLVEAGADLAAIVSMVGRLALSFASALRSPARLRLASIAHHLDRTGLRAVPIILLMTFLIGGIIAQQGFFHLRNFGATDYVVDLVAVLVLREIGVLLVAIMVAGRSGSSYAAELGSMKMREEIDALRTMGLDPVDVLILPRMLALILAVPMLAFLGMASAMAGAALVAVTYADMSLPVFLARVREIAIVNHLEVGLVKAPVMALAIGVVGAVEGLRVSGSAESLGLGATSSVVKSIFLVIVLDGIFAIVFAALGM